MKAAFFTLLVFVTTTAFANVSSKNYAQNLIDEILIKNSDLLVVMLHVTPPGEAKNIVIASNIGRIGKEADADDLRVINSGVPNFEIAHGGSRYEVELTLQDLTGQTIGAIGLVFPFRQGQDPVAIQNRAVRIRDELKRKVSNPGNLMEPWPFVASATTKTYGQKVINRVMTENPDLLIAVTHATPPASLENIISASSIGRIGKLADADDLAVILSGKPHLEIDSTGKRFEVELPFEDATGVALGALGLVFPYKPGDQEADFLKSAEGIRDRMKPMIPSMARFFELEP